jgi:nucleoside-diphosphate-sugar epimerase
MKAIIFGATGAIGLGLVEILSKKQPNWEIFAVTRSETSDKFSQFPNVKVVQGNPNNKEDTMSLCSDKDIVFSTIGFTKYETKYWAEHWPVVVDNLLAASSQTPGQKLIFCDNLYAYVPGVNISPTSKTVSPSLNSKPGVRALLRNKFQDRMNKRPDSISVVGGADFFGPGITNLSFFGDTFTKPIVSGKSMPLMIGSKNKMHDVCYSKDFSNA